MRPLPWTAAADQRGHGFSNRGPDFSREGYIADATALLTHLGLERPVVLGHSLGGVNAYQLAAHHPLLIHGTRSDTLTGAHAEELASRRPHTSLAQLAVGHTVHETAPDGFAATVSAFLDTLKG